MKKFDDEVNNSCLPFIFRLVSLRAQLKPEPRPDWSPLGASGADHFTSEWGRGWVILQKKKYPEVHMHKKNILAQDHLAKKIHARKVGWKKILARCCLN